MPNGDHPIHQIDITVIKSNGFTDAEASNGDQTKQR